MNGIAIFRAEVLRIGRNILLSFKIGIIAPELGESARTCGRLNRLNRANGKKAGQNRY